MVQQERYRYSCILYSTTRGSFIMLHGTGYPSVNVQSVVDHHMRFLSFDVRPGAWSDKKIWKHSVFGCNIESILPPNRYSIADSGYMLTPRVITPFLESEEKRPLSQRELHFNYVHSSSRMVVECSFGILKERFRKLKKPLEERSPQRSARVIVTCMVLHKILIKLQDDSVGPQTTGPSHIPSRTQHRRR